MTSGSAIRYSRSPAVASATPSVMLLCVRRSQTPVAVLLGEVVSSTRLMVSLGCNRTVRVTFRVVKGRTLARRNSLNRIVPGQSRMCWKLVIARSRLSLSTMTLSVIGRRRLKTTELRTGASSGACDYFLGEWL